MPFWTYDAALLITMVCKAITMTCTGAHTVVRQGVLEEAVEVLTCTLSGYNLLVGLY